MIFNSQLIIVLNILVSSLFNQYIILRKQARIVQNSASQSSQDSSNSPAANDMTPEQESRGTIQHGFSNRYVSFP